VANPTPYPPFFASKFFHQSTNYQSMPRQIPHTKHSLSTVVYKTMGLYSAIYAMIGATMLQMLVARLKTGKFEKMHLITLGLLVKKL
jgi:hypothetical protein